MRTALLLAALLAACEGNPRDRSGATPAIETPVGPIPGPHEPSPPNPNPYSDDDSRAIAAGFKLFQQYNCGGCHGDHGGGGMGPSLRDVDWLFGNTDPRIFNSIAHGRGHGMPSWGTKLPDDQVWQLVTYIQSLRTEREPEKPAVAEDIRASAEGTR